MIETDICIVGAGIVGLTTALGLSQRGYRVFVLDAKTIEPDEAYPDSRVYAINLASSTLFKSLGVWPLIEKKRKAAYQKMLVWDEMTQAHLDFDSKEIALPKLGDMIEERILKSALLERIYLEPKITLKGQTSLLEVIEKEDGLLLKTCHETLMASGLAVAEGAHSKTRESLNVALTTWPYHHQAIVAVVTTQKPHQNIAYQIFKPQGPLAFLPMSQPHDSAIVWSTHEEEAHALMAMSEADFNQALTQAFEHRLGRVTLLNQRVKFPLVMRHAKTYVGSRWLLLGDTAHTIHPLAGLGLNVGLQDVQDWLSLQDEMALKPWDEKILKAYARKRKYEVWQMIALMDLLKAVFSQPLGVIQHLRGLGLSLVNRTGLIKRKIMAFATGLKD